jgi:beta-carotene ketolase (CrtW type)
MAIGLALAAAIIVAWLALHIHAMWVYSWSASSWITAPLLAAALTWLYVGLFIIAHDCMHGSLAPFRPAINRAVGKVVLFIYAGFDFDALSRKHHLHHRHSGTEGDPDFDATPPHGFWHWYWKFMREYFSRRELLIVTAAVWTYVGLLGVPLVNVLVFWALPALLSSLQLFTFGTYLPHVPGADAFADRHRARTSRLGWGLSLLTCFHFGYHHEHHASPATPWWRLPDVHALAARRSWD